MPDTYKEKDKASKELLRSLKGESVWRRVASNDDIPTARSHYRPKPEDLLDIFGGPQDERDPDFDPDEVRKKEAEDWENDPDGMAERAQYLQECREEYARLHGPAYHNGGRIEGSLQALSDLDEDLMVLLPPMGRSEALTLMDSETYAPSYEGPPAASQGTHGPSQRWEEAHDEVAPNPAQEGPANFGDPASPGYRLPDSFSDTKILQSGPALTSTNFSGTLAAWRAEWDLLQYPPLPQSNSTSSVAKTREVRMHKKAMLPVNEQRELIDEGLDTNARASNLDRLILDGTSYLDLEDELRASEADR